MYIGIEQEGLESVLVKERYHVKNFYITYLLPVETLYVWILSYW